MADHQDNSPKNESSTENETPLQTLIEDALELEELDPCLYRSKLLWLPVGARGVFGGQVVGQALVAATKTVPKEFTVHSLHSYFLLPGDSRIPIIYSVQKLRDGRTYATRLVSAIQKGRHIFTCTASFQIYEESPISHQYPMPEAPPPETLITPEDKLRGWLADSRVPQKYHKYINLKLQEPIPVEIRPCRPIRGRDFFHPQKQEPRQMIWMKAKGRLKDDMALHHCVAAFSSDNYLLPTGLLAHGINTFSNPRLKMMASLDHTIWFHAPFRADEWLLYDMESPWTGNGRGLSFGRIFTKEGKLVMSCAQEGVIRATVEGSESTPSSKL